MKKFFKSPSSLLPFSVLALALVGGVFSAAQAQAETDSHLLVFCRADGYRISFYGPADQGIGAIESAEVERVIGGDAARTIADMECSTNPSPRPAGSDFADWLLLACSANDQSTPNSHFSASLRLDGDGRLHSALERITSESPLRVRSIRLADLTCQLQ